MNARGTRRPGSHGRGAGKAPGAGGRSRGGGGADPAGGGLVAGCLSRLVLWLAVAVLIWAVVQLVT